MFLLLRAGALLAHVVWLGSSTFVNGTLNSTTSNTSSAALENVDILSIMPLTGSWSGGSTMMSSARIAEAMINERQAILPGYTLRSSFFDDRCTALTSQEVLLAQATDGTYVAFVGAGCDRVCESVSFVADAMHVPVIAYECAGKDLSNTIAYPGLTRMGTVALRGVATVLGELKDLYEWENIIILTGSPTEYETEITTLENDLSELFTTETYSVFDDSATLMADIVSAFDRITADKRRVLYVVADESLYRKFICGSILAGGNQGLTWLSSGTWRHRWWIERDSLVEDNKLWLYEDSDTDVLRQFFDDLQRGWEEYAETDELRREGLQEAYITGLWDVLDAAEGPEYYHEVHRTYHPFYRTLMIDRGYSDIFLFELDGDLIYSTFKAVDFAENFRTEGGGIWSDTGLAEAFELALADPYGMHETPWVEYGPNDYVLASFLATGVFDENDELLAIFAIQLHPDTMPIEDTHPECTVEAMEDHFEGALNIAGLGRPLEQDMDEPLACFPDHTARTMYDLIETHLEEGYPSGYTGSVVPYPYYSVIGNAVDGTCIVAYAVRHMLDEGYTLSQLQAPTYEIYEEFETYIREELDFDGMSGRVKFSGNDKPNVISVDQVREESDENPIVVGLLHLDGVFNFTQGGVVSDAWQPAYPDQISEDEFPWLTVQISIPIFVIGMPMLVATLVRCNSSRAK